MRRDEIPDRTPRKLKRFVRLPVLASTQPKRERERITPESRRGEAAPAGPRALPEETRQRERVERERADLPDKSANRMYRGQDDDIRERRRSQQ